MIQKQNTFVRDSMITLTRQISSIVIGLLLLVLLARYLGPDNQGYYTTITLLPTLLLTFLNMGINTSTIFYVSKKKIDMQGAIKNNLIFGIIISAIGILVGILVIHFYSGAYFKGVDQRYLYLSLVALPFMILNIFFQTIFQGIQNFKVFNTILVVTQISTLVFVVLFLTILHFGLEGSIVAFVTGQIATFIFILVAFKMSYGLNIMGGKLSYSYIKESIFYGFKAHISNVVTVLNYRTSILMIIAFLSPTAVGYYSIAVNLSERLSIFSQSISSVLLPKIASLETDDKRNQLTSIVSRNLLVFMLVGTFVGVLVVGFIINLLLPQYSHSVLPLQILLPGIAVLSVDKILSNDIAGRGKPELNMYVSITNIIVNVTLNYILIPKYGIEGAAISTSITYFFSFIIKCTIFKKVTGQTYRRFLILSKQDFLLYRKLVGKVAYRFSR